MVRISSWQARLLSCFCPGLGAVQDERNRKSKCCILVQCLWFLLDGTSNKALDFCLSNIAFEDNVPLLITYYIEIYSIDTIYHACCGSSSCTFFLVCGSNYVPCYLHIINVFVMVYMWNLEVAQALHCLFFFSFLFNFLLLLQAKDFFMGLNVSVCRL